MSSPPKLPPRRVAFAEPATVLPRPPDLVEPAKPPIRVERYLYWTLPVDLAAVVPLTYWFGRPEKTYLALPSLLLPPLIHAAHGELESAGYSLAMRSAMLGVVFLAGRSARSECEDSTSFVCIPFGSVLLMQAAIIPVLLIDSLLLARRVREVSGWRRLPLLPAVSATADGRRLLVLSSSF